VREIEAVLHDMRGPLTAIRGQCHAIARAAGRPGELVDRLRVIDAEVERLVRAIERARASLDGTACDEPTAVVDVHALLCEAARRHDGCAGEAGVAIQVEGRSAGAAVSGRAEELRRLIDNLVGNAIRHAPHGTPVTLACARRDGRVIVGVRDEGGGLASTIPPGRAGTSRGAGWGLGLAIVGDIVERHAGRIVREEGRTGLTLRVELPVRPDASPAAS